MSMEPHMNDTDRGKLKNSEKNCPSTTFSTTNPTWTDPVANPGLHGERLTTNCLIHGSSLYRM
jgi:hypothetical protein